MRLHIGFVCFIFEPPTNLMPIISEKDFSGIVSSINNGSCVLFLGPHLERYITDHTSTPIIELLADELFKDTAFDYDLEPENAFRMATHYFENEQRVHGEAKARDLLIDKISDFYSKQEPDDLLKELADLNFNVIININVNDLMEKALRSIGKRPRVQYYNYKNALHNNELKIAPDTITARTPLIYNLFGSAESRQSLVLTETDKLRFSEELLQKESKASIPTEILQLIQPETSTYLFLGFDFNDWQLRLLFQKLGLNYESKTLAVYEANKIGKLTSYLYQNYFFISFTDQSPIAFIEQVKNFDATANKKTPTAKNVMVLYHEDDTAVWKTIEPQLKILERNEMINKAWQNETIMAGQNVTESIAKGLQEADVILFLASSNFNACDTLYTDQLNAALERHARQEACVIPIYISSMNLELTSYGMLPTLTPANGPLDLATNKEEKIKQIVADIKDIITYWQWK